MKAFRALLRVSMTALLRSISPGRGGLGLAVGVLALVPLLLSLSLGAALTAALAPLGALDLLPGFLCLMGGLLAFFLTAFGAGGLLFGGKDNDLLLALPIPDWMLLASRLLAVYLENLFLFALTLLPGMVVYSLGAARPLGLLLALPVAVFGAVVPAVPAALVGWALTWVTSRARHSALLANLGYGAVMLGCFALSIGINLSTRTAVARGELTVRALTDAFRGPMWLFGRMGAACTGDPAALAVTLLAGVLPAAAFVGALQGRYRRLLTRMSARAGHKKYRLTAQRRALPLAALLRKETGRFFNTPIYLFNTAFGLILLAAFTVFTCLQGDRMLTWLARETGLALTGADLYGVTVGTVCLLLGTVSTTSVSLSLEGRCFWLLKSLPIPASRLLGAKVWFNLLVGWPVTAVCSAALWWSQGFTPLQGAALLLVSAGVAALTSLGGAAANLRFPRLDAANDTIVCKQSLSAVLGIFGGMALVGVGIGLYLGLLSALPLELYLLGCTAVLALGSLLLALWLRIAGPRYIREL